MGLTLGVMEGAELGELVGLRVGATVGLTLGADVGDVDGDAVIGSQVCPSASQYGTQTKPVTQPQCQVWPSPAKQTPCAVFTHP